jgi:hypothetical protein
VLGEQASSRAGDGAGAAACVACELRGGPSGMHEAVPETAETAEASAGLQHAGVSGRDSAEATLNRVDSAHAQSSGNGLDERGLVLVSAQYQRLVQCNVCFLTAPETSRVLNPTPILPTVFHQ